LGNSSGKLPFKTRKIVQNGRNALSPEPFISRSSFKLPKSLSPDNSRASLSFMKAKKSMKMSKFLNDSLNKDSKYILEQSQEVPLDPNFLNFPSESIIVKPKVHLSSKSRLKDLKN